MGLLLILLFVIPLYVFHLVFTGLGLRRALSIPSALVSLALFLYAFWTLGDPFPILTQEHGILSIEQVCSCRANMYFGQSPLPLRCGASSLTRPHTHTQREYLSALVPALMRGTSYHCRVRPFSFTDYAFCPCFETLRETSHPAVGSAAACRGSAESASLGFASWQRSQGMAQ